MRLSQFHPATALVTLRAAGYLVHRVALDVESLGPTDRAALIGLLALRQAQGGSSLVL